MSGTPSVLVVDDDADLLRLLVHWLKQDGYSVTAAGTGAEAVAALSQVLPDTVLLDLNLPDAHGLDVLKSLKARNPRVPVVMLTAEGELETVVGAMQAGAWDYLTKPVGRTKLVTTVRNAVERSRIDVEVAQLQQRVAGKGFHGLLGESESMQELFRQMERVAASEITTLVRGESGTGKELVARGLHAASPRASGPFVAVNCAAIPENLQESELFGHERGAFTGADGQRLGRFEQANGGTLFLDEIGELSLVLQAKLLRALQERTFYRVGGSKEISVDVRIVAATHRDLVAMGEVSTFRQDLYWRLAIFELQVPALRDRPGDLMPLAQAFLADFAARARVATPRLSPAAEQQLVAHSWPGNVRELRNAMERASVLVRNGVVEPTDLPPTTRRSGAPPPSAPVAAPAAATPPSAGPSTLAELERNAIVEALERTGGNVSEVVRILGVPRTSLYRKLKELGLR